MFQKIAPILPALNIQKTNLFYRDKLGFTTTYFGNYLVAKKENIELFFFETKDQHCFKNSGCFIYVSNIEDLYAKFSSMDIIHPNGQLEEKFPPRKEFSIVDNNGNTLRFGEIG